jgi:hypothetical protein
LGVGVRVAELGHHAAEGAVDGRRAVEYLVQRLEHIDEGGVVACLEHHLY